jgi:hypothetical protein
MTKEETQKIQTIKDIIEQIPDQFNSESLWNNAAVMQISLKNIYGIINEVLGEQGSTVPKFENIFGKSK